MTLKRYKLTVEYNGACFCGWQKQASMNIVPSVQSALEEAIFKFSGERVKIVGSSRTDKGVHAVAQVAHCDLACNLPAKKIMLAINFHLKEYAVSIVNMEEVPDSFHARFSVLYRHYKYRIINRASSLVLEKQFAWQVFKQIDYAKLIQVSRALVGSHDFSSFRSSACQAKNANRTIEDIFVTKNGDLIEIDFISQSFLHNQIRIMVGTFVEISLGRNLDIGDIMLRADRKCAGVTAPPYGLYLVKVKYSTK